VPLLVWAGAALLGWVAGELIATEPILQPYVADLAQSLGVTVKVVTRTVEIFCAVLVVAISRVILKVSHARRSAQHAAE
jgi:hypothetical protein